MTQQEWLKLQTKTQGHTPGPWGGGWMFNHVLAKHQNRELAAAAPDLLAEVERLRGWIRHMREFPYGGMMTTEKCDDALTGAEVPE